MYILGKTTPTVACGPCVALGWGPKFRIYSVHSDRALLHLGMLPRTNTGYVGRPEPALTHLSPRLLPHYHAAAFRAARLLFRPQHADGHADTLGSSAPTALTSDAEHATASRVRQGVDRMRDEHEPSGCDRRCEEPAMFNSGFVSSDDMSRRPWQLHQTTNGASQTANDASSCYTRQGETGREGRWDEKATGPQHTVDASAVANLW
jgi:hypothetical protein